MTIQLKEDKIYLNINGRMREIGQLANRVLTVKRNPSEHLLKKWQAYGFNYALMKDERFFDFVVIEETTGKNYMISREDILRIGRIWRAPGIDEQIFLAVEQLPELI